jgi:hypothetical protein
MYTVNRVIWVALKPQNMERPAALEAVTVISQWEIPVTPPRAPYSTKPAEIGAASQLTGARGRPVFYPPSQLSGSQRGLDGHKVCGTAGECGADTLWFGAVGSTGRID